MAKFLAKRGVALTFAAASGAVASPAAAQMVTPVPQQIGATQVETLPPPALPPLGAPQPLSVQAGPVATYPTFNEERTIDPDGVETITRTRIIRSDVVPAIGPAPRPATMGATGHPLASYPVVFEREQWLDECYRRVEEYRESRRRRDRREYDCDAALASYMSYPIQPGAIRSLPAPVLGYGYGYTGQYAYSGACGCQQPQIAMIPVRSEVRQRVIVREQVREVLVPGERVIAPPPPLPRPIKTSPKLIKQ